MDLPYMEIIRTPSGTYEVRRNSGAWGVYKMERPVYEVALDLECEDEPEWVATLQETGEEIGRADDLDELFHALADYENATNRRDAP